MISTRLLLVATMVLWSVSSPAEEPSLWKDSSAQALSALDDDIGRNIAVSGYFDDLAISDYHFTENGFRWHLIRFVSKAKPAGPLWLVPHDDENAAFDAMIAAIKLYGGVGITVNSGPGSLRRQAGEGICGVRAATVSSCDPNRNFDAGTPLFTSAFLDQRPAGQPVIALHTNTSGFTGDGHNGRGEITILDMAAYRRGETLPRQDGLFAIDAAPDMANYDTLGLTPYLARDGGPNELMRQCGVGIAKSGVHFWHERVQKSDGSMSNYLALNRPDIAYFNAESRSEVDLALAASRHAVMIHAYLKNCIAQK